MGSQLLSYRQIEPWIYDETALLNKPYSWWDLLLEAVRFHFPITFDYRLKGVFSSRITSYLFVRLYDSLETHGRTKADASVYMVLSSALWRQSTTKQRNRAWGADSRRTTICESVPSRTTMIIHPSRLRTTVVIEYYKSCRNRECDSFMRSS